MQPTISVVMPIYNEEAYIRQAVLSLFAQDYPRELTEWVFVDGASTDATLRLLREAVGQREQVQILTNPQREIPAGLNIGIRAAHGQYIARMDAHSRYAPDYLRMGLETLLATGADIVGGAVSASGQTEKQRAIAAAFHSPFALGGGGHHGIGGEGWAKAVAFGFYRREFALGLSLYDETLLKSEDDDFFFRARKSGARIYLTPKMKLTYFPRGSFQELWKQYLQFGYWKMAFLQKHRQPVSLAQLIPFAFVTFLVLGGLLCLWPPFRLLYGAVLTLYLLLDLFFSVTNRNAVNAGQKALLFWTHMVIHVAYGAGGWRRLL